MPVSGRLFAAAASLALIAAAPAPDAIETGNAAWQKQDYAAALKAWRPIADKGDPVAQFNMGQAYKLGKGVPVDLAIAQSWYQKAAQQGLDKAQSNLGLLMFQNGKRAEAMPWIRKAADRGDARAQYILGTAMFNGDFATKDWPRAYALTMRAADQGLPPAKTNLATMDKTIPAGDRKKGAAIAQQMAADAQRVSAQRLARAELPSSAAVLKPAEATKPAPAAKVAAAKPTPSPKPAKTVAAAPGGRWKVQLGAFGSPATAQSQWGAISRRVGALSGLSASYEAAGKFTRLRAGPLASKGAAEQLCASAKAAGQACFPVAP